jgi:hypothetical protein
MLSLRVISIHYAQSPLIQRLNRVDEREQSGGASVHTGEVGLSAAVTPRNDTNDSLGGVDKGTARVTLARVFATSSEASADHVGGDSRGSVRGTARGAGDDWDGDLVENIGAAAILSKITPSGDGHGGSGSGVRSRSREGCVADSAASSNGRRELPDGDIEVLGRAAVAGVDSDGRDGGGCSTGVLVQAASADTETADSASGGADRAVSSSKDGGGVQESAAAEVGSAALKADDEGEIASRGNSSTNNVVSRSIIREHVVGVLRRRSRKDKRRKRDCDDGLETHDDRFK